MNPYIIITIIAVICIGTLAFILKEGFMTLLFWLALFAGFGFILYIAYKMIFPPGWKNR